MTVSAFNWTDAVYIIPRWLVRAMDPGFQQETDSKCPLVLPSLSTKDAFIFSLALHVVLRKLLESQTLRCTIHASELANEVASVRHGLDNPGLWLLSYITSMRFLVPHTSDADAPWTQGAPWHSQSWHATTGSLWSVELELDPAFIPALFGVRLIPGEGQRFYPTSGMPMLIRRSLWLDLSQQKRLLLTRLVSSAVRENYATVALDALLSPLPSSRGTASRLRAITDILATIRLHGVSDANYQYNASDPALPGFHVQHARLLQCEDSLREYRGHVVHYWSSIALNSWEKRGIEKTERNAALVKLLQSVPDVPVFVEQNGVEIGFSSRIALLQALSQHPRPREPASELDRLAQAAARALNNSDASEQAFFEAWNTFNHRRFVLENMRTEHKPALKEAQPPVEATKLGTEDVKPPEPEKEHRNLQRDLHQSAAGNLMRVKKTSPELYRKIQESFYGSLDDQSRTLINHIQKRVSASVFENHLHQRLVHYVMSDDALRREIGDA